MQIEWRQATLRANRLPAKRKPLTTTSALHETHRNLIHTYIHTYATLLAVLSRAFFDRADRSSIVPCPFSFEREPREKFVHFYSRIHVKTDPKLIFNLSGNSKLEVPISFAIGERSSMQRSIPRKRTSFF